MATKAARQREYKVFTRQTDNLPRGAHGRDTEQIREKIARPVGATPRRAQDWR